MRIRRLLLGILLGVLAAAPLHAAIPAKALPLRPYEKLLANFNPTLQPVKILTGEGRSTVTCEGKGWLEMTSNGRRILHLKGKPYEMGFQHGRLLAREVRMVAQTILQTVNMEETMRSGQPLIPRLHKIYEQCKPHIPAEYIEEARGLAAGSGLPEDTILMLNIFPELFHCSGFALWGTATADGKLYHGRILDYMNGIGLQSVAVVMVYEPEGKIPWVNISYASFIGSVTGMNARKIAIGEMGGRGAGKWDGMPMTYLVRRALENASTLDKALRIFKETPRTCEYYYVVSDGKIPSARGLGATPEKLDVIGPGQTHPLLPYPVKDGVLISATDRYKGLVMRVQASLGRIGASEALAIMRRPVAMKSCLHAVLFCPTDGRFWVANASRDAQPASEQPYALYSLPELLKRRAERGARIAEKK